MGTVGMGAGWGIETKGVGAGWEGDSGTAAVGTGTQQQPEHAEIKTPSLKSPAPMCGASPEHPGESAPSQPQVDLGGSWLLWPQHMSNMGMGHVLSTAALGLLSTSGQNSWNQHFLELGFEEKPLGDVSQQPHEPELTADLELCLQ